jgi:phage terminase small subunit
MADETEKKLTPKQKEFVDEYLRDFNATAAAKRAGYSEKTAYSIGSENLKKPEIAEEIRERLELRGLTKEEALMRLGEQARASFEDFITVPPVGRAYIDLNKAAANGKLHLIKKVTMAKGEFSLELHDSQTANTTILKALGVFIDRIKSEIKAEVDVTDANGAKAYLLALVEKVTPASAEGSDRGAD